MSKRKLRWPSMSLKTLRLWQHCEVDVDLQNEIAREIAQREAEEKAKE